MDNTERLKASQELNEQYGSSIMDEVLSIVCRLTSPINPGMDGKGRAFFATGARKCADGYLVRDHTLLVLSSICTMPINKLQLATGSNDLRDLITVCHDLTVGGTGLITSGLRDIVVIKTIADTFLKEVLFQDGFQPTYSTEALKTQIAVTLLSGDTSDQVAAIERAKRIASITVDKLLDIVIPKDLPEKAESSENHLKIFHAFCTVIAITESIDIVAASSKALVNWDDPTHSGKRMKQILQDIDPRKDAGTLSREVMQRIEALEQQVVDMRQELDALKPAK